MTLRCNIIICISCDLHLSWEKKRTTVTLSTCTSCHFWLSLAVSSTAHHLVDGPSLSAYKTLATNCIVVFFCCLLALAIFPPTLGPCLGRLQPFSPAFTDLHCHLSTCQMKKRTAFVCRINHEPLMNCTRCFATKQYGSTKTTSVSLLPYRFVVIHSCKIVYTTMEV